MSTRRTGCITGVRGKGCRPLLADKVLGAGSREKVTFWGCAEGAVAAAVESLSAGRADPSSGSRFCNTNNGLGLDDVVGFCAGSCTALQNACTSLSRCTRGAAFCKIYFSPGAETLADG
jgi:hypothetical protein